MAEASVTFFLEKLCELLEQEVHLLVGVRDEVILLRDKLLWLRSFLRDADGKRRENEGVKLWVTQIRDATYEAEDIIDKFEQRHRRRAGLVGFIGKPIWEIKRWKALHGIGKEIKNINARLRCISENRIQFGIENIHDGGEGSSSSRREKRAPEVEEFDVVGIEDEAKVIAKLLIEGEARRSIVSITGMGGLGKTTLARKVYNRDDVKRYFECFAWIYVSQEFNVRDLLYDIIKCIKTITRDDIEMMKNKNDKRENIGMMMTTNDEDLRKQLMQYLKMKNMSEEELRDKIFEYLQGKRYLVVIDDIWKVEAWDCLKASFPDEGKGSRIMFTTRNKDVALRADSRSKPHEQRFLAGEECWELFCKKAFPKDLGHCPSYLEQVGREIVGKCDGLPLALVVLGGLLSRKEQSFHEWSKVLNSISWQLNEGEDQISRILATSYYDLPFYLKPCFLHFGAFPEDSEIRKTELIRVWVAEGFVQERGDLGLEDVAEDCMLELIHRSLIQCVNKALNGRVKKCRIHDLLRDLAIKEAKQDNFLNIYGANADSASSTTSRRLTITQHDISKYISLDGSVRHLRSLYCFSQYEEWLEKAHWKCIYGRFKLLRVMHIDGVQILRLPDGIGNLIHLKLLLIRVKQPTVTKFLPSTISNLYNLQTLHIEAGGIRCFIPNDIWKLKQLRHLLLDCGIFPQEAQHVQLNKLTNLQTLSNVKLGDWIMNDLSNLTSLKSLRLYSTGKQLSYQTALFEFISKQENLRKLSWAQTDMEEFLIWVPISRLQHLENLYLSGRLEKLPALQDWPPNLIKLVLNYSRLPQDPMVTLEKLPKLQLLKLQPQSYSGRIMSCSAQGFPKLKILVISCLLGLNRWRLEEGALVNLRRLEIDYCEELEMIPEGLQHVTTLQELVLLGQPPLFLDRVVENGEDWFKIQHVPSIVIER